MTVLTWWHQTPFGVSDPILGRNVAFYVFTLPLLELVRGLALALVVLAAIGSAAVYVFAGELALTPFGLRMAPGVRRHGAVLAAALFLVLALGAWLDQPRQLVTPSGIIQGASYTDVHARMPAALVADGRRRCSAPCSASCMRAGRASWGLVAAAGALRRGRWSAASLYASALQRFAVAPNEQVARDAVHPAQHRGDAAGLRARSDRGTRADRRRAN